MHASSHHPSANRIVVVVLAAVAATLLVIGGPATAVHAEEFLLATEAVEGGVTPPPADSSENPNAPDRYEAPVIQHAAVQMSIAAVGVVVLLGLLYWAMVLRPRSRDGAGS